MSTGTVELDWVREEMFVGIDRYGNPLVVGSTPSQEPQFRGVKASDLLLISLISCSAYDVVVILQKQKQNLTSLRIFADGEQDDDPPYRFRKIHLRYQLVGDNLNEGFVARAIELSEEKYCSVYATLRDVVGITSEYEIQLI